MGSDDPSNSLQAEDDLEDLFENAPCGYISAHPKGHILKVNRTFLEWTGFDRHQIVGKRFQDFLNIAGKIFYETHFAPLLRMQGFFNEVALDIVKSQGSVLPVLVNAQERRNTAGEVTFIRFTVFSASDRRRYERELLDARTTAQEASERLRELNATLETRIAEAIGERMAAEEKLRQSQKMEAIGQLTGGIAHDFNNMLMVVLSSLGLMERRLERGDTDIGRFLSAAREGAERAASLTKRLLAFSRQQALSPEVLDANRLVSDMSELLRRTLGETIRLESVLAGGLWLTHADKNQLENAVLNLAINARDAMPDGGRLTVETANAHLDDQYASQHAIDAGQFVMVAVSDTGHGMSPEVLTRAFDPFFTTKETGKGTGLGLSQVFGFVKQTGGHVKIYSEIGHGTSVKIYLPRRYGVSDAVDSLGPVQENNSCIPTETILAVEDDPNVLDLSSQMLRELGYRVVTARDGQEALKALRLHPDICLLFTDVVMPDMNGRQLAEAAKLQKPDLKVLFTTGYTRNAIVHNGVLDPGVNLLPKPATLEQLSAKLRSILDAA